MTHYYGNHVVCKRSENGTPGASSLKRKVLEEKSAGSDSKCHSKRRKERSRKGKGREKEKGRREKERRKGKRAYKL